MLTIDRFEGEYAVCVENNKIKKIKKNLISPQAKEGDIIKSSGNMYIVDLQAGHTIKKQLFDMQSSVFSKNAETKKS